MPPVITYGILDTGSAQTWLQCLPCDNCFDPSKSSTYKRINCRHFTCALYGKEYCSQDNYCQYEIEYLDKSFSSGDVAEETVRFRGATGGETETIVKDFVFGCGHNNAGYKYWKGHTWGIPGVIGLIREGQSLIAQLSVKKFAYCFGDYEDPEQHGYVMFGDVATISGYTTPLPDYRKLAPHYFLDIKGISVDNLRLSIPNGTFEVHEEYPMVSSLIRDHNIHFFITHKKAFRLLVGALKMKMMNLKDKEVIDPSSNGLELCYKMTYVDLKFVPRITFHFGNVDLQLPTYNTWVKVNEEDVYCLAMVATDTYSIIGNFALQNFHIGFDLANNVLSFDLKFCALE
ncbi:LOW QUALITY PROTEIN: hypothetical protein AQUCO_03700147v1 [Aquilegia coerulea]|uniref:Peptidase A1 domain-containing protein n=1 Tax=Aquilegia coerulea TaxID=218851 RepID=A0A2G5CTQ3_AQUCA|nr:LOW QUALITY PROTEIN: hypothetical protein AQUCO_03700147v1 [Aquilegia coerulea]